MNRRGVRLAVVVLLVGLVAAVQLQPQAKAAPPTKTGPTVESAPAGLHGFPFTLGCCYYNFGDVGYTLQEYFVSGTAKTYTATPTTAPYVTRILVARPTDPKKFNGTVLSEWENVTAQAPAEPGMVWLHHWMLTQGYAYVAVSAQQVGVQTMQKWDPVRYASLSHPGDDYSYDIFSQAVEAVRHPTGLGPMGPLKVKRVVGYGQSQSAGRLNSYMNLAQNDANVIDGMIIQADGGAKKSFPALRIPLIHFETQDSINATPPDPATNPDLYRLWEVVGTSHIGDEETQSPGSATVPVFLTVGTQTLPWAIDSQYWENSHYGEEGPSAGLTCAGGIEMPLRYALDAALEDMNVWLTKGVPAPQPPRATFDSAGNLQLDQYGNAMGGLRLPPMDVPVATYKATFCNLLGITVPLTPDTLLQLYPTHDDYVAKVSTVVSNDVGQRILLDPDANEFLAKAQRSLIPLWRPSSQYGVAGGI
jgi:hypothetical protein